jgi:hypothetical protein
MHNNMNQGLVNNQNYNQGAGFQFKGVPMGFINDPLVELSHAVAAIIKQEIEILEIISGCETKNRYHVYIRNQQGGFTYLFKCKEESGWCVRQCCSSTARPFEMKVRHIQNGHDYGLDDYMDTFATFTKPFKCTCCCLARPEMTGILTKNKLPIGKVVEPCTLCDAEYKIYNQRDEFKFRIDGSCCQCGMCCKNSCCGKCSDVIFDVHNASKSIQTQENRDGMIKKKSGGIKEFISDADTFELIFPIDATAEEKLMLIGTVLMIDYRHFEDDSTSKDKKK